MKELERAIEHGDRPYKKLNNASVRYFSITAGERVLCANSLSCIMTLTDGLIIDIDWSS